MNAWIEQWAALAGALAGRESAAQAWLLTGVCLLAGLLLFKLLGSVLGGIGSWGRALLLFFAGAALMSAAAAAAGAWLGGGPVVWAAGALAALLLLAVPLTAKLEKVSYLTALIIWGLCGAAVAAVLLFEKPVMEAMDRGMQQAEQLKEHRKQAEDAMK